MRLFAAAPPRNSVRSRLLLRRSLSPLLVAGILAAGCDDEAITTPMATEGPTALAEVSSVEEDPFYWYMAEERRVPLDVVPDHFVIRSQAADAAGAAREALEGLGLDARLGRALSDGHRVLEVPGAQAAGANGVARELWNDPRFDFASPAYRVRDGGTPFLPFNQVLVEFESDASPSAIDSLNAAFGATVERAQDPGTGSYYAVLELPDASERSVLAITSAYAESPLTAWASVNRPAQVQPLGSFATIDDPFFDRQWWLDDNPALLNAVPVDINVKHAWATTTGSSSVTVVVIDTGVEADHEDIGAVVDGGDAVSNTPGSAVDPDGNDNHGTAVAGIISAQHNDRGVRGIAPGVTLVSMRIINRSASEPADGIATNSQIADLLDAAWRDFDADVINNSWVIPGGHDDAIAGAIWRAANQGRGGLGTAVVHGTGNNSNRGSGDVEPVQFPGSMAETIAVGAIDSAGAVANYTPRGPEIEIVAPSSRLAPGSDEGTPTDDDDPCETGDFSVEVCPTGPSCAPDDNAVVTLDLMGAAGCPTTVDGDGNYVRNFGGTSATAPMVSGAIALLLSDDPSFTLAEIRNRLAATADRWDSADHPDDVGAGKLNVNQFLKGPPDVTSGEDEPCNPEISVQECF